MCQLIWQGAAPPSLPAHFQVWLTRLCYQLSLTNATPSHLALVDPWTAEGRRSGWQRMISGRGRKERPRTVRVEAVLAVGELREDLAHVGFVERPAVEGAQALLDLRLGNGLPLAPVPVRLAALV